MATRGPRSSREGGEGGPASRPRTKTAGGEGWGARGAGRGGGGGGRTGRSRGGRPATARIRRLPYGDGEDPEHRGWLALARAEQRGSERAIGAGWPTQIGRASCRG